MYATLPFCCCEQDADYAAKTKKPDMGAAAGRGAQGRIGATGKTLLTLHVMKTKGQLKDRDLAVDARDAFLRHEGKKDVFNRFTEAYSKTQPKTIFAQDEEEEEGQE